MSDESIKPPSTSNKTLNPSLDFVGTKARVKFNEDCLKHEKITFNHGKTIKIYIACEIQRSVDISSYLTLENGLFGAVKLTKHVDLHKYSGYRIWFDRKRSYSIGNEIGRNVIILGVDMSSPQKVDNKGKDILILRKGPTQGIGEHSLTAEKSYSINFTKENTKFCLSFHCNGANSYLFVNGTEIIKFKAKDPEIAAYPQCLENVSKD